MGFLDGPKGWAGSGGVSRLCRRLDGESDVGEKIAEEGLPDEVWSAAACRLVTVELDEVEEWLDFLGLDCRDCLDG